MSEYTREEIQAARARLAAMEAELEREENEKAAAAANALVSELPAEATAAAEAPAPAPAVYEPKVAARDPGTLKPGRCVYYRFPDELVMKRDPRGELVPVPIPIIRPAMVITVFDQKTCNLAVTLDGAADSRRAPDANGLQVHRDHVKQGDGVGEWRWP